MYDIIIELLLGQVIKGWDTVILTMKRGEVCVITCLPEMAYGSEGFQGSIPPDSTLQFEVQLLSWHGTDCTKDPGGPDVNVLKSVIREGNKYSSEVKDSAEVTGSLWMIMLHCILCVTVFREY